jgi:hypothetical protein
LSRYCGVPFGYARVLLVWHLRNGDAVRGHRGVAGTTHMLSLGQSEATVSLAVMPCHAMALPCHDAAGRGHADSLQRLPQVCPGRLHYAIMMQQPLRALASAALRRRRQVWPVDTADRVWHQSSAGCTHMYILSSSVELCRWFTLHLSVRA